MRITLPSIFISWISAVPATGVDTPTTLAPSAACSVMKAPLEVWPGTVPRTQASCTVT